MEETAATLILGVGNVALGDEGFGIHVARRIKEIGVSDNVKVEAGGVAGFDLLGLLPGVERLVIVDVMDADMPPGEIGWFELDKDFKSSEASKLSFHQVGVVELLQIAGVIGLKPKVEFLVTRPTRIEWSFELSADVQQAADKAVQHLQRLFPRRAA
ncbi:hydrogenase maturation protease [Dehalogenimonas alkenigignens]|uniref:Hydrogenase maturation protease n=1 Tax=Dehalogenimonas alkenigignens TaxID=1217799 RepID=A0A0W0GKB5_9CHLR|nr:hydrogenase maturation protease [Dehalogenimonas alkenigignens]KTB48962.1 hydrogenase maturation protease [Dehalogenimonas alkenigignens]